MKIESEQPYAALRFIVISCCLAAFLIVAIVNDCKYIRHCMSYCLVTGLQRAFSVEYIDLSNNHITDVSLCIDQD